MHRYSPGEHNASVRQHVAYTWKVFCLHLCALLLFVGCGGKQEIQKREAQAMDRHLLHVEQFLDPEVLSRLTIRTDETGKYVEIDDMLFRVNEFEVFGYKGKQWANGFFTYDFAPDIRADATKRSQFEAACRDLTKDTGITCMDISTGNIFGEENHVYVINDPKKNESYVGRVGGRQLLKLYNWDSHVTIAHEIKHALGWEHEHSRPDRDQFVKVNWNNIIRGKEVNFEISSMASTGRKYDFDSIMHYRSNAFAPEHETWKKTIEALPPYKDKEPTMGRPTKISDTDRLEVTDTYGKEGTRWCGLMRHPRREPPEGCLFECYMANAHTGRWLLCGNCNGAEFCP